jgi:hypothetical protein
MSTWIQGKKVIELHAAGWKSIFDKYEDESQRPIGGPAMVVNPEGWIYRVMPDGTLENLDERLLSHVPEGLSKKWNVV